MSSSTAPFYRVTYSEAVLAALRGLGQRAKQLGARAEFVSTAVDLDTRLRADPLAVGESFYFLRNLGLHVRIGGNRFFYFRFAVDEGRRLVYVIKCVGSARLG